MKRFTAGILVLLFMVISVGSRIDADAATGTTTYTSASKVYSVIKNNLVDHKAQFTIKMNQKTMNQIGRNTDLYDAVVALDDKSTSKDADYLKLSINRIQWQWTYNPLGTTATLKLTVAYKATLAQEQKVDAKIKSVLKSLKLENKSDYKKVKAIHDYIINRVSYDQTFMKYSAYNALINKSSVCEGYAAAAYRMFLDSGIESRIIIGFADGGAHAWNIVKVNGKWYNIDLTWDDPIMSNGKQALRYDYFLKNDADFGNHIRDIKYRTQEFYKKYPIAAKSY